ncbi:hypothetical protein EPUS_01066 [Endocarpon pusillum Z07020]|uniref:Uncharacterized protein n=1 Tax=Endocarpon pusillum (strain Z07020 / HMAS-L-300199) TaxID=1263415 RepID=U1HG65_ENDPU|nr:uncharacterized protein EPUS_01066 [Endocarpon pusillum Z07020]ERF69110.1 hypothetical protein EPUS_01066 [Endocarpon pusillum Z07020]
MYKLILAAAALLSLTTATPLAERQDHPDQIALGRLAYSRGHQFVAWAPSRTTQQEACRTHATIQVNNSGFPDRPICGSPFSVGNLVDVTLACGTSPVTPTTSDVVAVIDASGARIENCVSAVSDYVPCDNVGSGLMQQFICTWEA